MIWWIFLALPPAVSVLVIRNHIAHGVRRRAEQPDEYEPLTSQQLDEMEDMFL